MSNLRYASTVREFREVGPLIEKADLNPYLRLAANLPSMKAASSCSNQYFLFANDLNFEPSVAARKRSLCTISGHMLVEP